MQRFWVPLTFSYFLFVWTTLLFSADFIPTSDDMDSIKTDILASLPQSSRIELGALGKSYGFRIIPNPLGDVPLALRDHFIMNAYGNFMKSTVFAENNGESYAHLARQAMDRDQAELENTQVGPGRYSRHRVGSGSRTADLAKLRFNDIEVHGRRVLREAVEPQLYIEGGDLFFATNKDGLRKVIISATQMQVNIDLHKTEFEAKNALLKFFGLDSIDDIIVLDIGFDMRTLCFFHLDIFMAIGPRGNVFMHSYELLLDALRDIGGIDPKMIEATENLAQINADSLKKVAKKLTECGFDVRFVPAAYHASITAPLDPMVSLLNGIGGYSQGTDSYYFITNGCFVYDEKISSALMEAFATKMQDHMHAITTKEFRLHFLGGKNGSFREVQDMSTRFHSGLHCLSVPLRLEKQSNNLVLDLSAKEEFALNLRKEGNDYFKNKGFEIALGRYESSNILSESPFTLRNIVLCIYQIALREVETIERKCELLRRALKVLSYAEKLASAKTPPEYYELKSKIAATKNMIELELSKSKSNS